MFVQGRLRIMRKSERRRKSKRVGRRGKIRIQASDRASESDK